MNSRMQGLLAAGALALYALSGAAALAQPASGQAGPPRAHHMMASTQSPAERAARLRNLLQLRPAQEPALQTYVTALDQTHRSMMGNFGAGAMPATTPERLALMQQMMAQRQGAMTAAIDATRQFYDQLDPGQKKAFDAMPMTLHDGVGMMGGPIGPPPPPTGR